MAAATTMLQGIGEREVSFSSLNIDAPLHHTAKLVLSSGDKRYTMGAFPTGEFVIKRGETKAISVGKDANLNVATPVMSTGDLDVASSVTLSGVKQWRLVAQENFDKGALGWSNDTTTTCGGYALLGGFGQFAGGEVKKTFANLTEHSQVRVVATFHFIDSWQGETAFARVDDSYVWTDRYDSSPAAGTTKGNICGKPEVPEMKFATPVDIVAPHDPMATRVKVSFGTTLDADPSTASWGLSSVAVYIR
jgi:hypothetical protein